MKKTIERVCTTKVFNTPKNSKECKIHTSILKVLTPCSMRKYLHQSLFRNLYFSLRRGSMGTFYLMSPSSYENYYAPAYDVVANFARKDLTTPLFIINIWDTILYVLTQIYFIDVHGQGFHK